MNNILEWRNYLLSISEITSSSIKHYEQLLNALSAKFPIQFFIQFVTQSMATTFSFGHAHRCKF
jgi:hypothetical protein